MQMQSRQKIQSSLLTDKAKKYQTLLLNKLGFTFRIEFHYDIMVNLLEWNSSYIGPIIPSRNGVVSQRQSDVRATSKSWNVLKICAGKRRSQKNNHQLYIGVAFPTIYNTRETDDTKQKVKWTGYKAKIAKIYRKNDICAQKGKQDGCGKDPDVTRQNVTRQASIRLDSARDVMGCEIGEKPSWIRKWALMQKNLLIRVENKKIKYGIN